jgi:hypothetical protein
MSIYEKELNSPLPVVIKQVEVEPSDILLQLLHDSQDLCFTSAAANVPLSTRRKCAGSMS